MRADTANDAATAPARPWRAEAAALFALGAPMGLTQIAQFSVQTVDAVMIGRLGPEQLAAAALGIVIFFCGWLTGFGPAMAVSPMVSQSIGARADNFDDVRRSVRMGLYAVAALTLPLFVIFCFAEPIALLLGQPAKLAALAGPYVIALAPGLPFALGVMTLRSFLAAVGIARAPLFIVIGATLLNAFLNWLLIYGNWGFPALGLVGAGIASSIAHAASFLAVAALAHFAPRARDFEIFRDFLQPDIARLREIVRLGWPIGVTMAFEGMLFNSAVFLMGRIGVEEVAAYQVALNVAAIAFMMPLGFAMAGSVRVGLAAGADDYARVRRASVLSIAMAVAAILLIAIPVAIAPRAVAGFYLDAADPANAPVIALVAQFLVIATAFMVFDATQVATNQALRGLKDVRWPMAIAGFSYWVVGFPVAAILGLGPVGASGVWIGLLASLVIVSALFSLRLYLLVRGR